MKENPFLVDAKLMAELRESLLDGLDTGPSLGEILATIVKEREKSMEVEEIVF